jgi:hypothetical protein
VKICSLQPYALRKMASYIPHPPVCMFPEKFGHGMRLLGREIYLPSWFVLYFLCGQAGSAGTREFSLLEVE